MGEILRVAMLGAYSLDVSQMMGGVQTAYAYLVKGLAQSENLDMHILTIRPPNYSGVDQVKRANLTIHFLSSYPRFERLRNYHTYQTIINKKLAQIRPDLIHAQDAGADALVAQRSGYPTVITVHGIRWEDGKHYSSWVKRIRFFYDSLITERSVVRHARSMIAISPYVTRYFKSKMRPDAEVYDVPNAIDEGFFCLKKGPDKQIVLFAGRIIPRKRVMDLVHAFAQVIKQVPSACLYLAGEVSTEPVYVEAIRKWVREAHLDEHVFFLGSINEESILQEFARCSILALPSAQETAPMVIAQAMAAAKPVVATRVGGVAEMVGDDTSRGFLVNVGDVQSLSAAIIHLLQHPDLAEKMGQKARAFAQENYHLDEVARRTNEVYRHIVSKEQEGHG